MFNPLKLLPSKSPPGICATASCSEYVPWVNEMCAPDQEQSWSPPGCILRPLAGFTKSTIWARTGETAPFPKHLDGLGNCWFHRKGYEADVNGFLYYEVSPVMPTAFPFLCVRISVPFYITLGRNIWSITEMYHFSRRKLWRYLLQSMVKAEMHFAFISRSASVNSEMCILGPYSVNHHQEKGRQPETVYLSTQFNQEVWT